MDSQTVLRCVVHWFVWLAWHGVAAQSESPSTSIMLVVFQRATRSGDSSGEESIDFDASATVGDMLTAYERACECDDISHMTALL